MLAYLSLLPSPEKTEQEQGRGRKRKRGGLRRSRRNEHTGRQRQKEREDYKAGQCRSARHLSVSKGTCIHAYRHQCICVHMASYLSVFVVEKGVPRPEISLSCVSAWSPACRGETEREKLSRDVEVTRSEPPHARAG